MVSNISVQEHFLYTILGCDSVYLLYNTTMVKIKGLSFSWKRAVGITAAKQKISRKTGIPTTKQGLERKVGKMVIDAILGKRR